MPAALSKKKLVKWLLEHDFIEKAYRASGNRKFEHERSGVLIVIQAHGRNELSSKHTGMIVRELVRAGFDRTQVRRELGIT